MSTQTRRTKAGHGFWQVTGLGLACCALLWFLQVLVPLVR